jgi:hypothetical protein
MVSVKNDQHNYRKEDSSTADILFIQQMQISVPEVCASIQGGISDSNLEKGYLIL